MGVRRSAWRSRTSRPPTEELLRALELPATYTALLVAGDSYLGAVDKPKGTIAYFETDPVNPTGTRTVTFDAGFGRADNGDSKGLKYYWDFGDGTFAVGEKVTHTFASSMWADVKLVVAKGADKDWGTYRQAVAVDSPSGAAPSTPACGTLLRGRAYCSGRGREGSPEGDAMTTQRRRSMKRAARKVLRSRWLAMSAFAALTALASVAAATTNSTAGPNPVSNPAHPVVDARWIYANDWYNATHFIYKRAGSDGCLQGATTCDPGGGTPGDLNNLPMNYNGTQEFNKWWGELGTTSTPLPNGELGKFMSKRDHLFPQASWQINVQELTIPGATCAGQQVMLAFHPDSQGVGQPNPGTSGTPLSTMYSGDWGTGSPYDSNMGALMNLEEIGSVLRWHKLNGTYPKRTIKTAVFDAELQGLIGSGRYSAAGTPAATVAAPVSVGDTNIKVTSTANLLVGNTIAIDESNTENAVVHSVGTPASSTTLVGPVAVGATKIEVASVNNIVAGQVLTIDTGGNAETVTTATVGTAQRTATTLAAAAAAGDTNIKVASVTNMVVGERVAIDTGANVEYAHDRRGRHRGGRRDRRNADVGALARTRERGRGAGPGERHHADLSDVLCPFGGRAGELDRNRNHADRSADEEPRLRARRSTVRPAA